MNPSATDDRTEAFARLLQELRDRPPGTSGEWLARLVVEIRPRGRDSLGAAREHLRSLIRILRARPEFAAALNTHLSLKVALRSRGISPEQTRGLWARVLRRFLSRPRDFFWPPAAVSMDTR